MTEQPLAGKKIVFLIANGFEEQELAEAQRALLGAGAKLKIASVERGMANGWHGKGWGHYFPVDVPLPDLLAADYDMLVVPGGKRSIDKLMTSLHTRRIVNAFSLGGKPMALSGAAVELLAFANQATGRKLTGVAEVQEKLAEKGAEWVAETLCVDGCLVTADGSDSKGFVEKMIEIFSACALAPEVQQAA